jgi:hypothetical protein
VLRTEQRQAGQWGRLVDSVNQICRPFRQTPSPEPNRQRRYSVLLSMRYPDCACQGYRSVKGRRWKQEETTLPGNVSVALT